MSFPNSKALGRNKHNRHKQQKDKHSRYKPKQKLPVHPTRIVLESNWSFYDEEPEEDSDSEPSPPDFGTVMAAAANAGASTSSKEEKKEKKEEEDDDDDDDVYHSRLFQIDGKLLNCALSTIPFYERLEIDTKYFTPEELEEQEAIATENEEKYRKMCEDRNKDKIRPKSKKLPDIFQPMPGRSTDETETDSTRDDIDDICEGARAFHIVVEPVLKFKATSANSGVVTAVDPDSREGMENWLDDLLS